MSAATMRRLRAAAAPATVENDRAAGCYRAMAPTGRRWSEGPHELVVWYEEAPFMPEARDELAERLEEPTLEIVDCDDPDCDWCADARAEGGAK